MKLLALSHLILSGSKSVGDLAGILGVSNTYASQLSTALVDAGFVVKERKGKKVLVHPNMESPFVQNLSKFTVMVGAYPPYTPTDFLEPESKRKVIWQLKDDDITIDELRTRTGYSRTAIYDALRPFTKVGLVSISRGKKKVYSMNKSLPLAELLLQLIEFFESDIDLRPLLERISSDEKVIALSVFGSQITGKRDRLSDVDALAIVKSPGDRNIAERYEHTRLQLNIYSRKGIIQLIKREPWFLKLALEGRILKGSDFLEGLEKLSIIVDLTENIAEIKRILEVLDRPPDSKKARIMMYCIRTAVAMKLFVDGRLSQEGFINELSRRYPEFESYRGYIEGSKINKRTIRKSKDKILEDLENVEKKEEKER